MRYNVLRWMLGGLGTFLALAFGSAPVRADYTPPSGANALLNQLSAFVNDFSDWNSQNGNRPLSVLQGAPDADKGATALLLFWMWLHSPGSVGGNGAFSSLHDSLSAAGVPLNPSMGTTLAGQLGNNSPSSFSNGGNGLSGNLNQGDPTNGLGPGDPIFLGGPPPLDPPAVPEPSSFALLAIGALGLLMCWKIRRRIPAIG